MRHPSRKNEVGRLRGRLLLTAQQFADRLGCSVHTVNSLETGRLKPSSSMTRRLNKLGAQIAPRCPTCGRKIKK